MSSRRSSSKKTRKHNARSYRSGLEEKISEQLLADNIPFQYEELKLKYTVPAKESTYTPDFILLKKDGTQMIIESKGLWDYADRYKHLLLRQQRPELDIRFVFSRSKQRISKRSKSTYGCICRGLGRGAFKGVTWKYSDKLIPDEWLEEVENS